MTTVKLTVAHLKKMFARAAIVPHAEQITLFALRGASPANVTGGGPADSHMISVLPVDYIHPRCSIGFYDPAKGVAIYPGSTVPWGHYVKNRIPAQGEGVNQLCVGLHKGYTKGMHPQSKPSTTHRALRMNRAVPVQRTSDDADFDGNDRLEFETVFDNIHCGWTASPSSSKYESLGCQVVVGFPRPAESGPWKDFISRIYKYSQSSFDYALFRGVEAQFVVSKPIAAKLPLVLRYGSSDGGTAGIVHKVQTALKAQGYLSSTPDGDFGFRTLLAVFSFQRRAMGQTEADGLVGEQTAAALGVPNWPSA